MADLSKLSLVPETDVSVDFDAYIDPSEFPPPIPEGVYTLVQGKVREFSATDGYLLASFEPHVVNGGEQDGAKLPFDRVSAKPFERQGVKVSMAVDHVRAVFGPTERPSTQQDIADALERGEGKPFKVQTQWEAGCNHKGTEHEVDWNEKGKGPDNKPLVFRVRGARNFPLSPNGTGHLDAIPCPTCGNEVRARSNIMRRIPA